MIFLLVEIINATPDAIRFVTMDVMENVGLLDNIVNFFTNNGFVFFEDGSIGE